jgi:hypothetical protein
MDNDVVEGGKMKLIVPFDETSPLRFWIEIAIIFIVALLLAGIAWAGEIRLIPSCYTSCVSWATLDEETCKCVVKKGHCPHCGKEGIKYGNVPIANKNSIGWIDGILLYLCPNGHLFWEKK